MAEQSKQVLDKFFYSGGPGTTGREVFEDSTATGPAARYAAGGVGGATAATPGTATGAATTGHHHHHHHEHGHEHGARTTDATLGDAGTTGSTAYGAGGAANSGTHGHHSHENNGHVGGVTTSTASTGATGASYGSGTDGLTDRVGSLNQGGAMYERTGESGPATHGAAGTDRFDTDKAGLGSSGTGVAGSGVKDTAITRAADAATGTGASSDGKAPTDSAFNKAITTADKDFTGESRGTGTTSGAYTDTHGHYETNASGPMGNSALTGREGNIDNNPVAQAKQAAGQSIHDVHTGTGATNTGTHTTPAKTSGASEAGSEKKKGIFQKIKDALE